MVERRNAYAAAGDDGGDEDAIDEECDDFVFSLSTHGVVLAIDLVGSIRFETCLGVGKERLLR